MRRLLRLLPLLIVCLSLVVAGCGDDEEPAGSDTTSTSEQTDTAAEATPTETSGSETAEGCSKAEEPKPREDGGQKKPTFKLSASKTYVATVVTTCGEFEITLDSKDAPVTGGSFVTLAKDGFFDGLIFHRIVAGFVIQGGDPTGTGSGGPGYSVVETPPEDLQYTKGVVAMAKTGVEDPGTSGSQFFVVTGEDAGLPPEYALLGKVTKGLDVVERIGVVPTGGDTGERPVNPVIIQQVKITEK